MLYGPLCAGDWRFGHLRLVRNCKLEVLRQQEASGATKKKREKTGKRESTKKNLPSAFIYSRITHKHVSAVDVRG